MAGRLQDRLAVVTGASRGIGRAVALAFAAEGAHTVLLARTVGALEEVDDEIRALGAEATLVPADLRDFDAIDRLGAAINERWGRLDVLVGNAGLLGPLTPLSHLDPKRWSELLDVNLTANWRLIRSLEPLLKRSDAGRAVFVTSNAAWRCRPYWGGYSVTKAALEALVKTWAQELEKTTVKVNLLNPGATRTAMRAQAMPGEDPDTLPRPEEIAPLFVELAAPECERHGETVAFER